jgi:hypothetical protein
MNRTFSTIPRTISEIKGNDIFVIPTTFKPAEKSTDHNNTETPDHLSGLKGNVYSIPFFDKEGNRRPMSKIKPHLDDLFKFAYDNPQRKIHMACFGFHKGGFSNDDAALYLTMFWELRNVFFHKSIVDKLERIQ